MSALLFPCRTGSCRLEKNRPNLRPPTSNWQDFGYFDFDFSPLLIMGPVSPDSASKDSPRFGSLVPRSAHCKPPRQDQNLVPVMLFLLFSNLVLGCFQSFSETQKVAWSNFPMTSQKAPDISPRLRRIPDRNGERLSSCLEIHCAPQTSVFIIHGYLYPRGIREHHL